MGKKREDLNPKQQRFVDEYLIDLSATQAAIRAGYSAKTAHSQGPRLLEHVGVKAAIADAIEARRKRTHMDADDVLREFARIASSDILNYVSFGPGGVAIRSSEDFTEDQARAIAEVQETYNAQGVPQLKFKLHDKVKALENLAKHLGLLTNKMEITGKDGEPVTGVTIRFVGVEEDKPGDGKSG